MRLGHDQPQRASDVGTGWVRGKPNRNLGAGDGLAANTIFIQRHGRSIDWDLDQRYFCRRLHKLQSKGNPQQHQKSCPGHQRKNQCAPGCHCSTNSTNATISQITVMKYQ